VGRLVGKIWRFVDEMLGRTCKPRKNVVSLQPQTKNVDLNTSSIMSHQVELYYKHIQTGVRPPPWG
jgi:hypothetical protein